jgi:hypothetical protein
MLTVWDEVAELVGEVPLAGNAAKVAMKMVAGFVRQVSGSTLMKAITWHCPGTQTCQPPN